MEFPRLPRFKRAAIATIRLTERDQDIIRRVHQHRFLRSSGIFALVGGSQQQVVRRLQLLYHHGYVERPRCQLDFYYRGGFREIVYGLGDKGAALLADEGVVLSTSRWSDKNRAVGRVQLEHWLLVSDVMVAFETACRKDGTRLILDDQLEFPGKPPSFRWNVDIGDGVNLGVVPDRVFAVDYSDPNDESKRAFFFLEADRATMPVTRKNLSQSSFFRKLLAYEATWSRGIHRARFGFNRFRVLTVTTSLERTRSLVNACSQLGRGHGLFLFADRTVLEEPEAILKSLWQSGRHGEIRRILEQ